MSLSSKRKEIRNIDKKKIKRLSETIPEYFDAACYSGGEKKRTIASGMGGRGGRGGF